MSLAAAVLGPLGQQAAPAAAFNPQTDITWHSLFWAEGSAFQALGLSDTDLVTTWPNETGESDATYDSLLTHRPTYEASVTALGSQPAVTFDGVNDSLKSAAFSSNPATPYSVVVIGIRTATGGPGYFTDGITSSARNIVASNGSNWGFYAGTAWIDFAVAHGTAAHLWTVTAIDGSTGSEKGYLDGTLKVTSNAGSHVLTGITLGAKYNISANRLTGSIAFAGIYEGDFAADSNYAAFKTWVASHYGITVA